MLPVDRAGDEVQCACASCDDGIYAAVFVRNEWIGWLVWLTKAFCCTSSFKQF